MAQEKRKRPFAFLLLVILLFIIGIGALISGAMLFIEPDGRLMQWTPDMLEGTPFTNYLIPGLILFLFVGVYPMFVVYTLLKKPAWRWLERINAFKGFHWAWSA